MSDDILCAGEILWDALPAGLFLGGAPFNVACHLHALGRTVTFASRVGDDVLGEEARRRLRAKGLDDALLQVDDTLPTGFVRVDLNESEDPDYDIVEPAAWDAIARTEPLRERTRSADALVFGSLAQRTDPSRHTIQALAEADLRTVFDMNLRPPFIDVDVIETSLQLADVAKMNIGELEQVAAWFSLSEEPKETMKGLAAHFGCEAVCVTRGADGALLWTEGQWTEHPGYDISVADPVGAGDAFLAAFLAGYLDERNPHEVLEAANRLGAYVASHSGALPDHRVRASETVSEIPLPEST